jgi:CheY-like chemotaxis protein
VRGRARCQRLRSLPLDRPPLAIAMSACARDEDFIATTQAGFASRRVKPARADTVRETIRALLGPRASPAVEPA